MVRTLARGALVGLLTGASVLGPGGRLLMRITALAAGFTPGFSVGGTLEVLAAGSLFGAIGGALFPLLPRRLGRWRPVIHAMAMFVAIGLTSSAARGAASGPRLSVRVPVLAAFGGLLLGYSVLLGRLLEKRQTSPASPTRSTGPRKLPPTP